LFVRGRIARPREARPPWLPPWGGRRKVLCDRSIEGPFSPCSIPVELFFLSFFLSTLSVALADEREIVKSHFFSSRKRGELLFCLMLLAPTRLRMLLSLAPSPLLPGRRGACLSPLPVRVKRFYKSMEKAPSKTRSAFLFFSHCHLNLFTSTKKTSSKPASLSPGERFFPPFPLPRWELLLPTTIASATPRWRRPRRSSCRP